MNKTINFRYLLRLFLLVASVAVAVHFIHRRQTGVQAESFLHQADEAQKKGDTSRMISYLSRYFAMRPGDVGVQARLALAMARVARTPDERVNAFVTLERVLGQAPDLDDVRIKATRLAMTFAPATAMEHLGVLIKRAEGTEEYEKEYSREGWEVRTTETRAEWLDLYGQCLAEAGEFERADIYFAEAIKHDPSHLTSFARRAFLLRQKQNPRATKADEVIADLLSLNKFKAGAFLIAANYRKEFVGVDKAEEAASEAVRLAPDDPEVLQMASAFALSRAERLLMVGKTDESKKEVESARQLLSTGLAKNAPPELEPLADEEKQDELTRKRALVAGLYRNLVAIEVREGHLAEAGTLVRKGIETLPEQAELTLSLADVLIRQKNTDEAADNLNKLQDAGYSIAVLDYHRARILVSKNDWLGASHILERVQDSLLQFPAFARQANYLLGECYDRIGEVDLRYEAFKRSRPADPFDPLWIPSTVAVAVCQAEMGRVRGEIGLTREAIRSYELVRGRAPGVAVPLARLRFDEALQETDKDARAKGFTRAEEDLKGLPESLDVALLKVDILQARNLPEEAEKALVVAKAKYPTEASLWAALALRAFIQKDLDGADKYLNDGEAKLGDRVELRLMRARLMAPPLTPEGKKKFAALAEGTEKLSLTDRRLLLANLAQRAHELGAEDLAGLLTEQLAIANPDNLAVHHRRFDRAMRGDNESDVKYVLADIRRIDGDKGASTRLAHAMYLIWKAQKQSDNSGLAEAKELLTDLAHERQGWWRASLGLGHVCDLRGEADEARESYARAVDQGATDPEVIARLAQLYVDRRDHARVDALLLKFPEAAAGRESLLLLGSESAFALGKADRALQMAEKAVEKDAKDYRKQLWLGRIRWMSGKRTEAEAPLRKAVALNGEAPEAWVTLVQYLVRTGRAKEAEKLLDEARRQIKKEESSLALAQCYEAIGRVEEAVEWYAKAMAQKPDDIAVLRTVANFQLRRADTEEKLKPVRVLLERILQTDKKSQEDVDFAKHWLAISLAISPDYEVRRSALQSVGILDRSRLETTGSLEELTSRALVLSLQSGRRAKQDAIRLFEEVESRRRHLPPEDEFLVAQLETTLGNMKRARSRLTKLVEAQPDNPLYLAYYVRFLLVNEFSITEARKYLAQLQKLQPDAPRTAELTFRLLVAENKRKEAVDLLMGMAKKQKETAAPFARLLENLKEASSAEILLQQIVADSKKPTDRLVLSEFYARQNRNDDAIDQLERGTKEYPPSTLVAVALNVLYTLDEPRIEDIHRVQTILERNKPKNEADWLMQKAAMLNLQADYAGAIAAYRKIPVGHGDKAAAMNNLAFLEAFHERNHAEALMTIRSATAGSKPEPVVMDTEAVILIHGGEAEKALDLLQDSIVDDPKSGTYFHLAWAYDSLKLSEEAQGAMTKAKKMGLRPSDLHPLERPKLREMLEK